MWEAPWGGPRQPGASPGQKTQVQAAGLALRTGRVWCPHEVIGMETRTVNLVAEDERNVWPLRSCKSSSGVLLDCSGCLVFLSRQSRGLGEPLSRAVQLELTDGDFTGCWKVGSATEERRRRALLGAGGGGRGLQF